MADEEKEKEEKQSHPLEATLEAMKRLKGRIEIIETTLVKLPAAVQKFEELQERVVNLEAFLERASQGAAKSMEEFMSVAMSDDKEETSEEETAEATG